MPTNQVPERLIHALPQVLVADKREHNKRARGTRMSNGGGTVAAAAGMRPRTRQQGEIARLGLLARHARGALCPAEAARCRVTQRSANARRESLRSAGPMPRYRTLFSDCTMWAKSTTGAPASSTCAHPAGRLSRGHGCAIAQQPAQAHLVEHIITEQLQQVAVARLRPCAVHLELPSRLHERRAPTHVGARALTSGRSLMHPSFNSSRSKRPHWCSRASAVSSASARLPVAAS